MIVDDRAVIIGSANINERSQRGNRDSEVAAVVRDTDMMKSTMGGEPFEVGRFAHTLRIRLMREHLGVNVDEMEQTEFNMDGLAKQCKYDEMVQIWDPESHNGIGGSGKLHSKSEMGAKLAEGASKHKDQNWTIIEANDSIMYDNKAIDRGLNKNNVSAQVPSEWFEQHQHVKVPEGFGRAKVSTSANPLASGIPITMHRSTNRAEELEHAKRDPDVGISLRMHKDSLNGDGKPFTASEQRIKAAKEKLDGMYDGFNLEKGPETTPLLHLGAGNAGPFTSRTEQEENQEADHDQDPPFETAHEQPFKNPLTGRDIASVDPYGFADPLCDEFYVHVWCELAISNTDIFREVFRCQPDDQVKTWKDYHKWEKYSEDLAAMQGGHRDQQDLSKDAPGGGPAGAPTSKFHRGGTASADRATAKAQGHHAASEKSTDSETLAEDSKEPGNAMHSTSTMEKTETNHTHSHTPSNAEPHRHKATKDIELPTVEQMETMLCGVRGHLVIWPTEWLIEEDRKNSWLFAIDLPQPLSIFD